VKLIQEAVELTRSSFRGQQLALYVRVEPEDQEAVIDRIQVQQVLFNLMRNSVEAMQDQPKREVVVAAKGTPKGMIELSVADTGPGLPEEVRRRLFQPFVTTKSDGMGIGLSVCQGIVELHGGRMWADDNAGGGTVFRFTVKSAPAETSIPETRQY
jgi:two-component system sensor kinase FixL